MTTKRAKRSDGLSVLSCQTLGGLDNGFGESIINEAIEKASQDTEDRGDDGKPRKVVIELTLEKLNADTIAIHLRAEAKLPPFRLNGTVGTIAAGEQGKLAIAYRAENPSNPNQPSIQFDPEEESEGDE